MLKTVLNSRDFYIEVGKKLLQIRTEKNLTQKTVAMTLRVSFQQYQKYEAGTNRIPMESILIFCRLTNTIIDDLIPPYNKKSLFNKLNGIKKDYVISTNEASKFNLVNIIACSDDISKTIYVKPAKYDTNILLN